MMENEIRANGKASLGQSLDTLRDRVNNMAVDIKDLYNLDNDNFRMIKELKAAVDKANGRIDFIGRKVGRNHRKAVLAFLGVGGLLYLGKLVFDSFDKRIKALENPEKPDKPEKTEDKKAEESDG